MTKLDHPLQLSHNSIRHEFHMRAIIIDMDEIKRGIDNYNDENPNKHHEQSSRLAKEALQISLTTSKYKKVILMGGGSASGKTEYVSSELTNKKAIIFDGTLGGKESTQRKITKVLSHNKKVEICVILPENISMTFDAFVKRKRQVPSEVFIQTHIGCRQTLLWITKKYPNIPIHIIVNKGLKNGALMMEEIKFSSITDRNKYILESQIDRDQIYSRIGHE